MFHVPNIYLHEDPSIQAIHVVQVVQVVVVVVVVVVDDDIPVPFCAFAMTVCQGAQKVLGVILAILAGGLCGVQGVPATLWVFLAAFGRLFQWIFVRGYVRGGYTFTYPTRWERYKWSYGAPINGRK